MGKKKLLLLEERIADLESPYLFEVGDKVAFEYQSPTDILIAKGLIVDRKYYYNKAIYKENHSAKTIYRENKYLILLNGMDTKVNTVKVDTVLERNIKNKIKK